MKITSTMRVLKVEERKASRYLSGYGDTAQFENISTGWWITLDAGASPISLGAGDERPALKVGDHVKITVEN